MKILYIKWLDHYSGTPTWEYLKDVKSKDPLEFICESVGFFIKDEKNYIVIATNINNDGKFSDTMHILKKVIIKKKIIRL